MGVKEPENKSTSEELADAAVLLIPHAFRQPRAKKAAKPLVAITGMAIANRCLNTECIIPPRRPENLRNKNGTQ